MANSLVTGGFGFVGRHLVRALLERGENITIFSRVPGSPFLQDVIDKLNIRAGSVDNWVQVASVVSENKIDTIYHVAACVGPIPEQEPSVAFNSNVIGSFNILEAARIFGVKSVIFTSSIASYQVGDSFVPDGYLQRPSSIYGMTKVCGERLGEAYWQRYGINFRGVRFTTVNGPGRSGIAAGLCVVWTLQMAALGRPFKVFLEPDTEFDTIYVKDAVRLLIELGDANEAKLTRRIYTLPSIRVTPRQLVEVAKKYIPNANLSYKISPRMMEAGHPFLGRCFDSSFAERDWEATLEYDLDRMMQEYIKECSEHRELMDYPIPEL